jgi:hypothetical protein
MQNQPIAPNAPTLSRYPTGHLIAAEAKAMHKNFQPKDKRAKRLLPRILFIDVTDLWERIILRRPS